MSLDIYTDTDDLYYENDLTIKYVNIFTFGKIKVTFINCPNLKAIFFEIGDNEIDLLVSKCSNLEYITIDDTSNPNSITIKKGCNNIKSLCIKNTKCLDIEKQDFSNLNYIYLDNIESLKFNIEQCYNLSSLTIKNCTIGNIIVDSDKLTKADIQDNNTYLIYFKGNLDNLKRLLISSRDSKVFIDSLLKSINYLLLKIIGYKCPHLILPNKIDNECSILLKKRNEYNWTLKNFIYRNMDKVRLFSTRNNHIRIHEVTFNDSPK